MNDSDVNDIRQKTRKKSIKKTLPSKLSLVAINVTILTRCYHQCEYVARYTCCYLELLLCWNQLKVRKSILITFILVPRPGSIHFFYLLSQEIKFWCLHRLIIYYRFGAFNARRLTQCIIFVKKVSLKPHLYRSAQFILDKLSNTGNCNLALDIYRLERQKSVVADFPASRERIPRLDS